MYFFTNYFLRITFCKICNAVSILFLFNNVRRYVSGGDMCETSVCNVATDEIITALINTCTTFCGKKCFASVLSIVNMDSAFSRVYDSLRFRRAYYCTLIHSLIATSMNAINMNRTVCKNVQ